MEQRGLQAKLLLLCLPGFAYFLVLLLSGPYMLELEGRARLEFAEAWTPDRSGLFDPAITGVLPPPWLRGVMCAAGLASLSAPVLLGLGLSVVGRIRGVLPKAVALVFWGASALQSAVLWLAVVEGGWRPWRFRLM